MTIALLITIIILLIGRFILQVRQGRAARENLYATAYAVRKVAITAKSADELYDRLCEKWEYCDFELVAIIKDKGWYYAFLQSKKIKNYYER